MSMQERKWLSNIIWLLNTAHKLKTPRLQQVTIMTEPHTLRKTHPGNHPDPWSADRAKGKCLFSFIKKKKQAMIIIGPFFGLFPVPMGHHSPDQTPRWPRWSPSSEWTPGSPPEQAHLGQRGLADLPQNWLYFTSTQRLGGKLDSSGRMLVSDTQQSYTKVSVNDLAEDEPWFLPRVDGHRAA